MRLGEPCLSRLCRMRRMVICTGSGFVPTRRLSMCHLLSWATQRGLSRGLCSPRALASSLAPRPTRPSMSDEITAAVPVVSAVAGVISAVAACYRHVCGDAGRW